MSARHDALLAACAAFGLDATGNESTLAQRIGTHIAECLFGTATAAAPVDTSSASQSEQKRPRDEGKKALSNKAARWHAVVKKERPLVKEGLGLTGNADVLKEVAARYKRHLAVGTPNQPPLIVGPSTDTESEAAQPLALPPPSQSTDAEPAVASDSEDADGLVDVLKELDETELNAALAAHSMPINGDKEEKARALARVMMA